MSAFLQLTLLEQPPCPQSPPPRHSLLLGRRWEQAQEPGEVPWGYESHVSISSGDIESFFSDYSNWSGFSLIEKGKVEREPLHQVTQS